MLWHFFEWCARQYCSFSWENIISYKTSHIKATSFKITSLFGIVRLWFPTGVTLRTTHWTLCCARGKVSIWAGRHHFSNILGNPLLNVHWSLRCIALTAASMRSIEKAPTNVMQWKLMNSHRKVKKAKHEESILCSFMFHFYLYAFQRIQNICVCVLTTLL